MARASRLKLFRTPMGFFDAVVAAPSQAAALRAWGVTSNLFAEKLAEEVTNDPELLKEASRSPGEVLRQPRGDPAAILAAPAPPKSRKKADAQGVGALSAASRAPATKTLTRSKRPPKPKDRSKLDAAEAALCQAKQQMADDLLAIDAERKALATREAQVRRRAEDAVHAAEQQVAKARAALR